MKTVRRPDAGLQMDCNVIAGGVGLTVGLGPSVPAMRDVSPVHSRLIRQEIAGASCAVQIAAALTRAARIPLLTQGRAGLTRRPEDGGLGYGLAACMAAMATANGQAASSAMLALAAEGRSRAATITICGRKRCAEGGPNATEAV